MAEHYRGIPITQGSDGRWHAKVTVGKLPNGRRDRRHRSGATAAEVRGKLQRLLREVDAGRTPRPGRAPTVGEWLDTWLQDIAPHGRRGLAPLTVQSYRAVIQHWIVPALGSLPLDQVDPDDLDRLYATMRRAGRAESYVLKAHYILSRAFSVAMRRGKLGRNVTDMVETPGGSEGDRSPLPRDVVRRVLAEAAGRRNAARWYLGLTIGLRQAEALGLRWDHVDLEAGTIVKAWQLQRIAWAHGCDDPRTCARPRCRFGSCPPRWGHGCADPAACRAQAWRCPQRRPDRCGRHPGGCPPACPPACTGHARGCPQRVGGGLQLTRPKTWRPGQAAPVVAVPQQVVELLRQHRAQQAAERLRAGSAWRRLRGPDGRPVDLVFTQADGGPICSRRDWRDWQRLLLDAGAPPARVHAMRHTTATTLLELGVDIAVVQEVLGHADIRMTRRYAAVSADLTRQAADRMGAALALDGQVVDMDDRRRRAAGDHGGDRPT